jgi:hypothetical protein
VSEALSSKMSSLLQLLARSPDVVLGATLFQDGSGFDDVVEGSWDERPSSQGPCPKWGARGREKSSFSWTIRRHTKPEKDGVKKLLKLR